MGNYDDAIELYNESLAIIKETFGNEHNEIAEV